EDERVEVELTQVLRRLLLERLGAPVGERHADRVGGRRVRRQIAAPVRRADLQARELVERAFEDQVRKGDGRLERVADRVLEPAAALEPVAEGGRRAVPRGMGENKTPELLGLGPERVKPRARQLLAVDAAAEAGAA